MAVQQRKKTKNKTVARPLQVRKKKDDAAPTKNHTFESFSKRINRITIDPVRRSQRLGPNDVDDILNSHFRTNLERWQDLNLSESFGNFSRAVLPLTESLVQIIHFQDQIFQLLCDHLSKREPVSLEPLLDLLVHFVHDLGARSERHFLAAVQLVASIASDNTAVDVVEWSFTALTWMFRYLSRLLVPDLRPLFDVLAPQLGQQKQKYYVVRFAAESLAFLIRKAAVRSHKDHEPLERIVSHIQQSLEESASRRESANYTEGIAVLIAEAVRGVNHDLHSGGLAIIKSLLYTNNIATKRIWTSSWEQLVVAVFTNVIHNTTDQTFEPVHVLITEYAGSSQAVDTASRELANVALILSLPASVRMGSRIRDWDSEVDALLGVLPAGDYALDPDTREQMLYIIRASACSLHYAPLPCVLTRVQQIITRLSANANLGPFLAFCMLTAQFNIERYRSHVHPRLVQVILLRGPELEGNLISMHRFMPACVEPLTISTAWRSMICDRLNHIDMSAQQVWQSSQLFHLDDGMIRDIDIEATIRRMIFRAATASQPTPPDQATLCSMLPLVNLKLEDWTVLEAAIPQYGGLEGFVTGLNRSLQRFKSVEHRRMTLSDTSLDRLTSNLTSHSHELRLQTLNILGTALNNDDAQARAALELLSAIEMKPVDFESTRDIVMQIRRIAPAYRQIGLDRWERRAIALMLFGLLTKRIQPIQQEVLGVITDISQTADAATALVEVCMAWLETDPIDSRPEPAVETHPRGEAGPVTEFQCINMQNMERLEDVIMKILEDPVAHVGHEYERVARAAPDRPLDRRMLALRVLTAMPIVAEKHTRQIVPLFLTTTRAWESLLDHDTSMGDSISASSKWSRSEKLGFLELLKTFRNPRAAYRVEEMYGRLLDMLSSGDVQIQRLALQALFTWKDRPITRYEEHLVNILDDNLFRDELTNFVQGVGGVDGILHEEDREVVMPLIMRLLFGRSTIRASSDGPRSAVLRAISSLRASDLEVFLKLTTRDFGGREPIKDNAVDQSAFLLKIVDERKQIGFLNMLKDLLDILSPKLSVFIDELLQVLIYCLLYASNTMTIGHAGDVQDSRETTDERSSSRDLKTIRNLGFKCLTQLFVKFPDHHWQSSINVIRLKLVNPRIRAHTSGSINGLSGLMHLLEAWSVHPTLARYFANEDLPLLQRLVSWLSDPSIDQSLQLHILRILLNIADLSGSSAPELQPLLLQPVTNELFQSVQQLLLRNISQDVLDASIRVTAQFSNLVIDGTVVETFLGACVSLLRQPPRRVAPKLKSELVRIIGNLLNLHSVGPESELFDQLFQTTSQLFEYFRDLPSRVLLGVVMQRLVLQVPALRESARLVAQLESTVKDRLLEPDYTSRISAFETINGTDYASWSAQQWHPIICSMLFHLRDVQEYAIRSSAELGLRRFVKAASYHLAKADVTTPVVQLSNQTLLPAIRHGVREIDNTIRMQYVQLLGAVVESLPYTRESQEMSVLLVNGDSEASFFNNILHIQQHRRLRAIKRLSTAATEGKIGSWSISTYFLPLLEHCVFTRSHEEAHIEAHEALVAIGVLSGRLSWKQYHSTLTRYIGYISTKPELEKIVMRLLSHTLDSLVVAVEERTKASSPSMLAELPSGGTDTLSPLAISLPSEEAMEPIIVGKLLPPLRTYLHHKEESVVTQRVPIALSAVKMLKVFSQDRLAIHLPPIMLDVCHILRSRDQGSRDLTRKTLVEFCQILGSANFSMVLKGLRTALLRGYQLHVLSYTVHSILVALDTNLSTEVLDSSSSQIMDIVMSDSFGVTGKEKEAEEYISKMKEVKSSKSSDTLEIMARHVSSSAIHLLIEPLQALLEEKMTLTTIHKADELLRRLSVGIIRNEAITGPQILGLCYEIIRGNRHQQSDDKEVLANRQVKLKRYLVNVKGVKDGATSGATTSYGWKLTRFAFELLRATLNKYEDLQTSSRLQGFIPILGDGLLSQTEELQTSAIKVLTTIVRVPLPAIDEHCRAFLDEAVRLIRTTTTTNTEFAQTALKLVAAILREKPDVPVKDSSIAYLLKRLKPDLEEPDRQGLTFNFLRAIVSRKIVVPEVYEIMDVVAEIMVTNQTRTVRDLARAAYFQFLMDYPQAKERFKKQILFLVRNLGYKYQEGRQSVLEAIHLLLTKVAPNLVQDLIGSVFVPLVLMLANDESAQCREMAARLIREVYQRSDADTLARLSKLQEGWLLQDEQLVLLRVALQCYSIKIDAGECVQLVEIEKLNQRLAMILADAEASSQVPDWELVYFVLQAFVKVCEVRPSLAFDLSSEPIWNAVRSCLAFPHAWVKTLASKLTNRLLIHREESNLSLPLGSAKANEIGLHAPDVQQIVQYCLSSLSNNTMSESLAKECVDILVSLGQLLAGTGLNTFGSTTEGDGILEHDNSDEGSSPADGDEWAGFDDAESSRAEAYPSPPTEAVVGLDNVSDEEEEASARKLDTISINTLLARLTAILRAPNPKCKPLIPALSALSVLTSLVQKLTPDILTPSLQSIFLAIYNLVDPSVPQQSYLNPTLQAQQKLVHDGAEELLGIIRTRVGTEVFARAYQEVRTGVKQKRESGRRDRVLRRERSPEVMDRRKRLKRVREGEKRREKSRMRGGMRRGY